MRPSTALDERHKIRGVLWGPPNETWGSKFYQGSKKDTPWNKDLLWRKVIEREPAHEGCPDSFLKMVKRNDPSWYQTMAVATQKGLPLVPPDVHRGPLKHSRSAPQLRPPTADALASQAAVREAESRLERMESALLDEKVRRQEAEECARREAEQRARLEEEVRLARVRGRGAAAGRSGKGGKSGKSRSRSRRRGRPQEPVKLPDRLRSEARAVLKLSPVRASVPPAGQYPPVASAAPRQKARRARARTKEAKRELGDLSVQDAILLQRFRSQRRDQRDQNPRVLPAVKPSTGPYCALTM